MERLPRYALRSLLSCLCAGTGLSSALAAASLECQVTYGGSTQAVLAAPADDPYQVAATDIAGRFRFKPVLAAQASQLPKSSRQASGFSPCLYPPLT